MANSSIKADPTSGYCPENSTSAKNSTDLDISKAQFELYGDFLSFSMNGTLLRDTLCLPNEESCISATEYDQMFPFFLVSES